MISLQSTYRVFSAFLIAILLITIPGFSSAPAQAQSGSVVYVVISIDTENGDICWYAGHPCAGDPTPIFDTVNYKPTGAEFPTIFSAAFRDTYVDSFGTPFKMSWFVEMDQQFEAATYLNEGPLYPELNGTPAGYTAIMDTLNRYWHTGVVQYGDGIYYHHHVQDYVSGLWRSNGDVIGNYDRHYDTLSAMIVERAYYPSTYRAGWLWEDTNMNTYLNDWVPFDYSASSSGWIPYHPNINDPWSSAAPNLRRWMTRTDGGVSQANINSAFAYAQTNGAALYSYYFHDREDMTGDVASLHSALQAALAAYPGVQFQYVNAQEGIQNILQRSDSGFSDRTPPVLGLTNVSGDLYQVTSNESLWQTTPYVAAKYVSTDDWFYQRFTPTLTGALTWQATIPSQITVSPPAPQPVQFTPSGITASSYHADGNGYPTNAIDNNVNTWWDSAIDIPGGHAPSLPAWIDVEFPAVVNANKLEIHFYDGDSRYYTYGVQASADDGATWTQIVPAGTTYPAGQGLRVHTFTTPVALDHVRITVTANSNGSSYAHIREIRLYGVSAISQIPVDSASASSWNPASPGYPPENAIDGSNDTWWDSGYQNPDGSYGGQVPAWLRLDLGEIRNIQSFSIRMYDNDGRTYTYSIDRSTDGSNWTEAAPSGVRSGETLFTLPEMTEIRYLRINVTDSSTTNPNGDFAHVKEVKFYGEYEPPEPEVYNMVVVGAGGTDLYGNPSASRLPNPTAVDVAKFEAAVEGEEVNLSWQTSNELDIIGFNIYRSETAEGVKEQRNPEMIPAEHPGQTSGAFYELSDTIIPGEGWYYWLEIIRPGGTEWVGPATAGVLYRLWLPAALK